MSYNPIDTAPKDGKMIRLLVDYTENSLDDAIRVWTIGFNALEDTGEDEWKFAGWNWCQDCFDAGEGTPVGWLPWENPDPEQP